MTNWRHALRLRNLFSWDSNTSRHLSDTAWVDGLRGIAALQVLIFHFFARYPDWGINFGTSPAHIYQWPLFRSIWAGGSGAVALFFVISGFAITIKSFTLLRRRKYDELYRGLSSSVIRRGFRLYLPIIILAIPSIFLVRYFDLHMDVYVYRPNRRDSLAGQFVNWFKSTDHLINPYMYPDNDPNFDAYPYVPTSWTIPIEYQGSILCYVMMMALAPVQTYRLRASILVVMAAYALHRGSWWNSNFLVGVTMADYWLEQKKDNRQNFGVSQARKTAFLIMFLVGWYFGGAPPVKLPGEEEHYPRFGFELLYNFYPPKVWVQLMDVSRWYWIWCGNLTFIGVSQHAGLQSIFASKFCQWLGKLSFSVYLLHAIVYAVFTTPIRNFASTFGMSRGATCIVEFTVMVPLTFILGGWFEKFVDQPCIAFAKNFERFITSENQGEKEELPLAM